MRFAAFGVVAVIVAVAASFGVFKVTPQGFLPAEDQGAFFAAMRLPEGASVNRTEELVAQVENILKPIPGVQGVLSVVGLNFIDYVASSNSAFFVVRLKPYEERTAPSQKVDAILAAAAYAAGAEALVSADAGFSTIANIRHVTPDIGGISGLIDHHQDSADEVD